VSKQALKKARAATGTLRDASAASCEVEQTFFTPGGLDYFSGSAAQRLSAEQRGAVGNCYKSVNNQGFSNILQQGHSQF
jgi:hypothetical protein